MLDYHSGYGPVLINFDQFWPRTSGSLLVPFLIKAESSIEISKTLYLFEIQAVKVHRVHKNTLEYLSFTWNFLQKHDKMWIQALMHIICDIPKSKSCIDSRLMIASSWLNVFRIVFFSINTCFNMIGDVQSEFWSLKIWSNLSARWIWVILGVFVYFYYFVCVIFVLISKFLS